MIEPVGRITRFFQNGQTLSGQLAIDAITGASPTGAVASNQVQTVTGASGSTTQSANQVPTHRFSDVRGANELEWGLPVGSLFHASTGVRSSLEKDYESVGAHEALSLDVLRRLATVTLGGGFDQDQVFPIGGTPGPLLAATEPRIDGRSRKRSTTGLVGLSTVLSRRWLMGGNFTRTRETGYLTEPYKVITLIDPGTGNQVGQLTESRPSSRDRRAILTNAVYHQDSNVLYLEYRYYWDDWGLLSHTADVRYLFTLPGGQHFQPHVRVYTQKAADFYQSALDSNAALPDFASADYRLGPLDGVTVGATYGFHIPRSPGEWSIRAEYLRQWGRGPRLEEPGSAGEPGEDPGGGGPTAATSIETIPGIDIGSIVVGYSLHF